MSEDFGCSPHQCSSATKGAQPGAFWAGRHSNHWTMQHPTELRHTLMSYATLLWAMSHLKTELRLTPLIVSPGRWGLHVFLQGARSSKNATYSSWKSHATFSVKNMLGFTNKYLALVWEDDFVFTIFDIDIPPQDIVNGSLVPDIEGCGGSTDDASLLLYYIHL